MGSMIERDYTGCVAVCSTGRVGYVVGRKEITFPGGDGDMFWYGIGLDGKGLWCARTPVVLHSTLDEYIKRLEVAVNHPGAIYPPIA